MVKSYDLKCIESKVGYVVILAGSDSDISHIKKITASLKKYDIPHKAILCSAHKQPYRLMDIINQYNEANGSLVFIAVAGGTDALSGTLAFHSRYPVISCPPDAPNQSCLTNPLGSSNAYIQKPENVARFIAQMYSHNPKFRLLLESNVRLKIESLEEADGKVLEEKLRID